MIEANAWVAIVQVEDYITLTCFKASYSTRVKVVWMVVIVESIGVGDGGTY